MDLGAAFESMFMKLEIITQMKESSNSLRNNMVACFLLFHVSYRYPSIQIGSQYVSHINQTV
jgi:hypothetical protein